MATKILREARIIMPRGPAEPGLNAHEKLTTALIDLAGGVTITPNAGGAWRAPGGADVVEDVLIYDVAIADDQNTELARIALEAGRALGQEAVYVRYSHGVVAILDVAKAEEELARGGAIPAEKVKKHPADASVGDIWKTRDGSVVAIFHCDGATEHVNTCVLLRRGSEVAACSGARIAYEGRLGGRYSSNTEHPLNLVEFVSKF